MAKEPNAGRAIGIADDQAALNPHAWTRKLAKYNEPSTGRPRFFHRSNIVNNAAAVAAASATVAVSHPLLSMKLLIRARLPLAW